MKTLTEFFGPALKAALKTKEELTAAGKTAEELPAAMGEALKLEGDKLTRMMGALEAVGSKWGDLKRVVVIGLNEGEKAPNGAQMIGEAYFMAEYYPPIAKAAPTRGGRDGGREGRGGRGGRDGGKRDGKRGGRGGRDGERSGGGRGPGRGDGERSAGGRPPRAPRAPMPSDGKVLIGPPPSAKPVSAPASSGTDSASGASGQ